MTRSEAQTFLERDGGRAPCSRYGWDGASCAPVAALLADVLARETGGELTAESADYAMGLVVNDHDDPAYTLANYATPDELESIGATGEDWLEEGRRRED